MSEVNANTENVSSGKPKIGGAIVSAILTDDLILPESAVDSIDSKFESLGYISDDGLGNKNTPSSGKVKAWGGVTVATPQEEKSDTFTFKLIECMRESVLKLIYGEDNVSDILDVDGEKTGRKIVANSDEQDVRAFVIDMILDNGTLNRLVIPNGKVTEISDITYKDNEVIGYEVTVEAMPDGNGNNHYGYFHFKKD